MARSSIIRDLIKKDSTTLLAELDAVRKEKAELEIEEELLTRVLAIQRMQRSHPAEEELEEISPPEPPTANGGSGGVRTVNVSAEVLEVLRAKPGVWLSYEDIHNGLREREVMATRNTVRVAVRRWAERGLVEQDDQRFRAPVTDPPNPPNFALRLDDS